MQHPNQAELNGQKQAIVLVPLYKVKPSAAEKASLIQLFNVLGQHQIAFFTHADMDLTEYQTLTSNDQYQIFNFDQSYFSNLDSYSKLLLTPKFYQTFQAYQFLMIYQLDCWVFKDELSYWCSQDYDYIGAPWYEGLHNATSKSKFIGVGNGGFSLRKVKSHLKILSTFSYIESPIQLMRKTFKNRGINFRSILHVMANFTFRNNTFHSFNNFSVGEDLFWGTIAPKTDKKFKLPTEDVASKFAMELNAPQLYKKNNNELPFGCHAWEKYDKAFWLPLITPKNTSVNE